MHIKSAKKQIVKYDAESKKILSNKYVLANILELVIPEYKEMTYDKVLSLIEDGDISKKYIQGIKTEDKNLLEGSVDFDLLFKTIKCESTKEIDLYFDIEAQNINYLTYKVINRAQYYIARLITRQKNINFVHSEYDKIVKSYTIWINPFPSKEKENTINFYSLKNIDDSKDKINSFFNIIFLNVGFKYEYDVSKKKDVLEMLDLLFHANDENVSMKTKILKDKYHIIIDEKEVNAMCSLGEGIEYIGIQKGMQQGMQQGIQKGREVEKIDNAISFINSGIPSNEVYRILGVNKDVQKKIEEKLRKN